MASEASSSNSSIRRRQVHCGRFCDRISRLPNEVLCHILSFLLTEQAVRTCILSKRWRYVWTSVPTIDITDNPWDAGSRYKHRYDANEFIDFVDSVFRLNDAPCLKRFRLFCDGDYDSSRISDWISSVALRRVQKIELWFDCNKPLRLPLSIFTCNKIVSLNLGHTILVNVPKLVNFPCLKTIELLSMKVVDGDAMKNLLAGCPSLEELYVAIRSLDDQAYTLHVKSSSLKTFKVITDDFPSDENEGIVIDAPNLQHLTLTDFVTLQIDMNYLSSLIRASIGLERGERYSAIVGTNTHNRVTDLLRKISNTEYLCLSLDTMECLEHEGLDNFPVFHNLNNLVVKNYQHYSWRGLSTVLECSPNLITLVLGMSCVSRGDLYEWHPQLCPPKCCMLYLEKIELGGFQGTPTEMELVRHLLVTATVLKKMSIQYYSSSRKDEELQIVKKLLMFPRGSTTCQIEFI